MRLSNDILQGDTTTHNETVLGTYVCEEWKLGSYGRITASLFGDTFTQK